MFNVRARPMFEGRSLWAIFFTPREPFWCNLNIPPTVACRLLGTPNNDYWAVHDISHVIATIQATHCTIIFYFVFGGGTVGIIQRQEQYAFKMFGMITATDDRGAGPRDPVWWFARISGDSRTPRSDCRQFAPSAISAHKGHTTSAASSQAPSSTADWRTMSAKEDKCRNVVPALVS